MEQKISVMVNGKNYFNQESFTKICESLEQGMEVQVYIDCIGHTRNNYEQEQYKRELMKKYGDNLIIELNEGYCSYSYTYQLVFTS